MDPRPEPALQESPETNDKREEARRPSPQAEGLRHQKPRRAPTLAMDETRGAPTTEDAKAKNKTPTLRAGARRLEGYRADIYRVDYAPDRGLRLKEVDRVRRGRPLAADVGPFEQEETPGKVSNGGENVARALAAQLAATGWRVRISVAADEQKPPPEEEKRPSGSARSVPIALAFRGRVAFFVAAEGSTARATLRGDVQVLDTEGKTVFGASPSVDARVTPAQVADTTKRTARAEREALAAFIRALLADPGLSDALVRFIKGK